MLFDSKIERRSYIIINILFISSVTALISCSPGKIESLDDAKEYAVGTWMGCRELEDRSMNCLRYEIYDDGIFMEYSTSGNSDSWGAPSRIGTWQTGKYKFPDTGKEYFYIEFISTLSTFRYPIFKGRLLINFKSDSEPGPYLSKKF